MEKREQIELLRHALEARQNAYAPYSHYTVGAAVLTDSGRIYTGCNVENASYGLTCCAERNAIFKAVGSGERKLLAVAVTGPEGGEMAMPCGACRQVLAEFAAAPEMPVIVSEDGNGIVSGAGAGIGSGEGTEIESGDGKGIGSLAGAGIGSSENGQNPGDGGPDAHFRVYRLDELLPHTFRL